MAYRQVEDEGGTRDVWTSTRRGGEFPGRAVLAVCSAVCVAIIAAFWIGVAVGWSLRS